MSHSYIALLRGINIGPHKKVPMAELKLLFSDLGFNAVKTILNTGNVIFESDKKRIKDLPDIANAIFRHFGFSVPVMVYPRSLFDIIIESDPFNGITVGPDIRLYVTFLGDTKKTELPLPYLSPDNTFRIISKRDEALFSVLDLSKSRTIDAMQILEQTWGKNITTRNWNTLLKIANT